MFSGVSLVRVATGLAAPGGLMSGEQPQSDRWSLVVIVAAAFTFLSFLVHEIYSLDIWWQVAIGRHILETFSVPGIDLFSVAGAGRPYHDSHWLFQVVVALADGLAGMTGVQMVMIAVWSAVAVLVYRSSAKWVPGTPAAVLTLLALMASVERFLPRPEIITLLGIAVFYSLLQDRRYVTPRQLALLGLVQVVWANSHGLFVIGPLMTGCFMAAAAIRRLRGSSSDLGRILKALVVVLVSTLVTPFGWNGWRYAALLFQEAGGRGVEVITTLGELSPTFGESARSSQAFWVYAVLLAITVVSGISGLVRRKVSASFLVAAAMLAASLFGRRNIPLFALVAAPFIAEAAGSVLTRIFRARWVPLVAIVSVLLWSVYPLSGRYYVDMELTGRTGFGVSPSFFPHRLPAVLDDLGFAGTVLNSNVLGGFYLYHGFPDRLPLTDGRWEVYDPDRLIGVLRDSRNPGRWRGLVARYGVTGMLLGHGSPEAEAILPEVSIDRSWMPVYLDRAASFWIKREDRKSALSNTPVDLDWLPEIDRIEDGLMLNRFYQAVGGGPAQRDNLRRLMQYRHRRELVLRLLGDTLVEQGGFAEAEGVFSQLLGLEPANDYAMNQMAFFAYRRGDYDEAARWMRQALQIEPGSAEYRENERMIQDRLKSSRRDGPGEGLDPR